MTEERIEERINSLIEMYQSQLNGANECLKEDIRALIKAERDELHCFVMKKDYLSSLTKEINDTEQKVSLMKEFLGQLKCIKEECTTSEWIPLEMEDGLLYCPIPEVDEEILVTDGKHVWQDTWIEYDDGYALDGNYELDEILAWMPLPKPYMKEKK